MNSNGDALALATARYDSAMARFDAANAEDPNREAVDGRAEPKELVYGLRMSAMLVRFAPESSEGVKLAARCQHIRRWEIPRDSYPRDKVGYKAWRTRLQQFHAEIAGDILAEVGYDPALITRVQSLLRKESLKRDPETQTLEDVIGLVFLEHYLVGFVDQHPEYDDAKWIDILQKTWRKMSPSGHLAALTLIKLPHALLPLISKAVAPQPKAD